MIEIAPRVVAFVCRWVAPENTVEVGGAKLVPVLCSGRVSPGFLLQAFEWGASGVLVAGCGPEKCRYLFGARQQEGQFGVTREVVRMLGIGEERVKLAWVSGPEQLAQVAAEFTAAVKKLPPLPISARRPEPETPPDIADVREAGRAFACIDCGKCTGFCPVSRHTKTYSPHRIVGRSWFSDVPEKELADAVWGCLTCGLCERRCPAGVKYATLQQGLRARARAGGDTGRCTHSGSLLTMMRLFANGDVPPDRLDWIPPDGRVAKEGDTVLYVGCAPYFDKFFGHMGVKTTDATRGALRLLNAMGIEPVVMPDEICCGHDLLWSGDAANFEKLAKKNIAMLKARGVKRMVFPCAECHRTAAKDWPAVAGAHGIETLHIAEMVAGSRLALGGAPLHATIQDPCRLTRHMGKGDVLRGALSKAKGLKVTEMLRHGVSADCCGSSSWLNCSAGTAALQAERLASARATGASVLLTACPKCEIHLACAQFASESKIHIENVASVLAGALEPAPSTAPVKSEAR